VSIKCHLRETEIWRIMDPGQLGKTNEKLGVVACVLVTPAIREV
jgi:hypothetical protein